MVTVRDRRERRDARARKDPRLDSDVAAVLAGSPVLAWRAGWSLVMSAMSLGFLVLFGSISMLQGLAEAAGAESGGAGLGGKVAVSLALYAVFWLAGLVYGVGEAAEGSVEVGEAYRGAFLVRGAMWGLGLGLVVWLEPGLGEAFLTAGLLVGALLEGACVGGIARDHGLSIGKAAIVACLVAGLGSRKGVEEKEGGARDV